jgi:hypothetical protein
MLDSKLVKETYSVKTMTYGYTELNPLQNIYVQSTTSKWKHTEINISVVRLERVIFFHFPCNQNQPIVCSKKEWTNRMITGQFCLSAFHGMIINQ